MLGTAGSDSWGCGTAYDFLDLAPIDLTGKILATTTVCSATDSTVHIRFDSAETWYTGSSTPNPVGQPDAQGLVMQELGHAHQAWAKCTDGASKDPCQGYHYDSTFNASLCDTSNLQAYSTMCSVTPGSGQEWRWRSLETHDIDLVENMY